jgi:putative serine protease PepD
MLLAGSKNVIRKEVELFVIIGLILLMAALYGSEGHCLTDEEVNTIEIYRNSAAGVVNITSVLVRHDFFFRPFPTEGTGSGVIIDKDGIIITNLHVIEDASSLEVTLADGSKWAAKVVGKADDIDIAVISIEAPMERLKVLSMGDSSEVRVGQKVYAIGNPFGLGQTLTEGVISSVNKRLVLNRKKGPRQVIQTDAAINPGNSGGPLINSSGEIIGINTTIFSPTGANVGIGFAIPVNSVKKVVPGIISRLYRVIRLVVMAAIVLFFIFFLRRFIRQGPRW